MVNPNVETVLSILMYSGCSISMILLNKLLLFTYKIDFPLGLLFIQNFAALILVISAKRLGWVSYPDIDAKVIQKWLPLTVVFVMMLWTSMKSLHLMSIALQTIIKNTAIVFTAIGDWRFYGKQLTTPMFGAFALMVVGSAVGTQGNKWWTYEGMFWTLANVVSTVGYVLYMKRVTDTIPDEVRKNRYSAVFYNNLLSSCFLFPASVWSLGDMFDTLSEAPTSCHVCVFLMTMIGAVMTFATFWCMGATSPTTYSVTGSLNKIPLAFLGIWMFDQWPTALGYLGIAIGMGGGLYYTFLNLPKPKISAPPGGGSDGGGPEDSAVVNIGGNLQGSQRLDYTSSGGQRRIV